MTHMYDLQDWLYLSLQTNCYKKKLDFCVLRSYGPGGDRQFDLNSLFYRLCQLKIESDFKQSDFPGERISACSDCVVIPSLSSGLYHCLRPPFVLGETVCWPAVPSDALQLDSDTNYPAKLSKLATHSNVHPSHCQTTADFSLSLPFTLVISLSFCLSLSIPVCLCNCHYVLPSACLPWVALSRFFSVIISVFTGKK